MRAEDILALMRDGDASGVALLEMNPVLAQLALAWPNVPIGEDDNPKEECPPDVKRFQVRWLWGRIIPDPRADWIRVSGLPDAPHVRRACDVLIDNKIVLPDGSLPRTVEKWAQRKAGIEDHDADGV